MKKSMLACFVATFILLLVCLYQIADLKNQVLSTLDNQFANTQNFMDRFYSDFYSQMEELSSLLSSKSLTYGNIDADTQSVTIHCAVTPKEYHPTRTAASLILNDNEYPMTLENGEYSVSLPVSLLERSLSTEVQFTSDGTIQTETINWNMSPRYDLLADARVDFSGSTQNTTKDGIFFLQQKGEINIHVEEKGEDSSIQAITMIEYIDGEETARTNIPLSTAIADDADTTSQESIPTNAIISRVYSFYHTLDKTFEIPFGSTFVLCIDLTDEYGFNHRTWLNQSYIDSNGAYGDAPNYSRVSGSDIYDESIKSLWPIGDTIYG